MENTIENLLSRIVPLEECFNMPPSSVTQQKRQMDLMGCASIPPLLPALIFSQQAQFDRKKTTVVV